jgi:LruC domain-containing protein
MKLSFKNILPILLIFTLLILFAGCTTPSEEQPGYTPGTITGIIAAPCCLTSDDPVTEPCCVSPEYWCYYCQKTWKLQKGIEVVLTYGKVKVATVYTNEDGEFTFTNVDPGKNYVVTAYCPDFADNRPLVKDVALQLIEGGSFDTNITDLVSTSLGLVVDFLVYFTDWGPEDISLDAVLADRPEFPHFSKFKALVYEVRRVVENCELNLLTDDDVLYATCRAAEEISGLVIGCGAGFTPPPGPGPTPTPGECDGNTLPDITDVKLETISIFNIDPNLVADIHLIVGTPYEFCVTATDTDNVLPQPLTYYLTIDGVDYYSIGNSNCLTITPEAGDIGTHEVSVNVYDGCGKKTWGPVKVVVCPPFAEPSLVINIMEPPKGKSRSIPLEFCMDKCATITSVTVYYNCTPPGFSEITDLTDTRLAWTIPAGIIFTKTTNGGTVCLDGGLSGTAGTYNISVTYTDPCGKTANGSKDVEFKDCSIQYTLTMAVSPIGGGTTSPLIGAHSGYAKDFVANISATANAGYQFVNWTVDTGAVVADPNSASTTVVVDLNKTVTAHFIAKIFILGTVTIAFEDLEIPRRGSCDYDYNDWVADLNITTSYYEDTPNLTQVKFEVIPEARGAGYDHRFHILIPKGTFSQDGTYTLNVTGEPLDSEFFDASVDNDFVVIPDTRAALGSETHNHTNTKECEGPISPTVTAVLTIDFTPFYHDFSQYDPYSTSSMHGEGLFFDPYLEIDFVDNNKFDPPADDSIHTGNIRMLTVPDDWSWPEEGKPIWDVYAFVTGPPLSFSSDWWTSHNNCIYGDNYICGVGPCSD